MKTPVPLSRPTLLVACALLATTLLAGCHATTDARWTTADDTVYRWEHALPALPVEVRGQLPNLTHEQIAQAFPRALPVREPTDHPAARLVVDAGGDTSPAGDAYCETPASAPASTASRTSFALTMSLCDGTRLVASSRTRVDPDKSNVEDLPRQIDRLKNLMLIGIDGSPAQLVHIQS
jgi:outer membrane murein-binding lipoprotein Lpp